MNGIYQFTMPYLTHHKVSDKDGYHQIRTVDAEIHIGRREDLLEGKIATVIVYSTFSFSNYVQDLFRNIRLLFFPNIFTPETLLDEKQIRYLEVHAKSQDLNDWHEVEMHWDQKRALFRHPLWNAISPNAWYFQYYQQKIAYYAEQGLIYMNETDTCEKPTWLIQALQETQQYVEENELELDPCSLLINSLQKLAGLEINRLSYTPVITTKIISQIHKLKMPGILENYLDQYPVSNIYAT